MKKLLIILVACTFLFACSEDKKSDNKEESKEESVLIEKDNSNFYTGKVVILYQNGNIKYVENYQDGVKEGEYMNCYKTGSKKAEGKFNEGKRTGVWVWYDENGEVNYAIDYDQIA